MQEQVNRPPAPPAPIGGGPPPPSQRNYGHATPWQKQATGASPSALAQTAIDFLRRVDSVAPAGDVEENVSSEPPRSQIVELEGQESATTSAAEKEFVQASMEEASEDFQKKSDEENAAELANLLESFSFQESKTPGSPSATLLDTFLALLAERKEFSKNLAAENTKEVPTSPGNDYQATSVSSSKKLCPQASTFIPSGKHQTDVVSEETSDEVANGQSPQDVAHTTPTKPYPFTGHFGEQSLAETQQANFNVPTPATATPLPVTYAMVIPIFPGFPISPLVQFDKLYTPPSSRRPNRPLVGLSSSRWAATSPLQDKTSGE